MPFDDFIDDEKTISAVRDQIMIIGEAVKHIPAEITEKYRETPWDEIAGMLGCSHTCILQNRRMIALFICNTRYSSVEGPNPIHSG